MTYDLGPRTWDPELDPKIQDPGPKTFITSQTAPIRDTFYLNIKNTSFFH